MIKKIKKHKNKLFILMLTLISALTLFLNVGKTYAYETFDNFSETLQLDTTNLGTNVNSITYNSTDKYYAINVTIPSNYSNVILYFTPNDALQYTNWSYYSLLFNGVVFDSTNTNRIPYNSDRYINVGFGSDNTYIGYTSSWCFNTQLLIDNKYFSICICPNVYNSSWYVNDAEKNRINMIFSFSGTYTIRLYNCDFFTRGDLTYKYIYDKYYGNIAEQYDQLQTNYETLQDDYTTLENNYNDLEGNYNDLQHNYNDLQESYDNLGNVYSSLWNNIPYFTILNEYYDYSYMSSFSTILQHYNADVFSIDDMKENNIVNGSTLNLSNITSLNNTNDIYNLGIFFSASYLRNGIEDNWKYLYPSEEINISVVPPINLNNNNKIVLTFKGLRSTMQVNVIVITYNDLVTNNFVINKDLILKKVENFDFELFKYLESMSIIIDKVSLQNATNNFTLNATASNYYQGYSIGFDDGYNSGRSIQEQLDNSAIKGLTDTINAQQSDIADMRNTINLISTSNEQLTREINEINANNLTWQKFFFTMADTPLKTVASVLGKDSGNAFLGINLYDAFIGLITTLVLIWLIKKFI